MSVRGRIVDLLTILEPPAECNGNPDTLSHKEMEALRQIAEATNSRGTVAKLDEALKIKTRPMGEVDAGKR